MMKSAFIILIVTNLFGCEESTPPPMENGKCENIPRIVYSGKRHIGDDKLCYWRGENWRCTEDSFPVRWTCTVLHNIER